MKTGRNVLLMAVVAIMIMLTVTPAPTEAVGCADCFTQTHCGWDITGHGCGCNIDRRGQIYICRPYGWCDPYVGGCDGDPWPMGPEAKSCGLISPTVKSGVLADSSFIGHLKTLHDPDVALASALQIIGNALDGEPVHTFVRGTRIAMSPRQDAKDGDNDLVILRVKGTFVLVWIDENACHTSLPVCF